MKLIYIFTLFFLFMNAANASQIYILKANKVTTPKIQPRFDTALPDTRMIFKIISNVGGIIKVQFFLQKNIILGKCKNQGGDKWTCPVTSLLYDLPELELRNNQEVFLGNQFIGQLAVSFNDDSVKLSPGYSVLPFPITDGFVLKYNP